MKLQSSQHGYLMVDHSASPGLPDHIARASGYDPAFTREGKVFEAHTLTCSHCKCTVVKNPLRQRERAKCSKCGWHYICDLCAAGMLRPDYDHTPFEKFVDLAMSGKLATGVQQMGSPPKLILPASVREAA